MHDHYYDQFDDPLAEEISYLIMRLAFPKTRYKDSGSMPQKF